MQATAADGRQASANVTVSPGLCEVTGTPGNDVLFAQSTVCGLGGNGDDVLDGGADPDLLLAGRGDDLVEARDGTRDVVSCGPGDDTVIADDDDIVAGNCEVVARA